MKKLLAILLVAMMLVFTLASCDLFELPPETTTTTTTTTAKNEPHVCEHACEECGKCLDAECAECTDKCEGHVPPHECEHVCAECGKCLDGDCAECTEKCEGHHEHSYEAEVTAPTCENAGYATYTCSCGSIYTGDKTEALGHEKVTQAAVGATCTATGLTAGEYCTRCDYKVEQEEVAALGHSYNAEVTAPTCLNGGYTTYTCATCGDTYKGDEKGDLGHSYGAEVTAPTCLNGGYTTYTCATCGDTYKGDEKGALGHSYNAEVTAPTCFAAGYTTHTCHCGDSYKDSETAQLTHIDANDDEMCDHGCGTEMLKPRYTVTLKYGSHTKTVQVKEGTKLTEADLALDSKYPFALVEWQKDGVAYDANTAVMGEMTLTAVLANEYVYEDFETEGTWNVGGSSTTYAHVTSGAISGNQSLQFTVSAGNGIYRQNLKTTYDFTDVKYIYFKVKVSTSTDIGLRFFSTNTYYGNTLLQSFSNSVKADGAWHLICVDISGVTFDKSTIQSMLIMSSTATTVEIDDIIFVRDSKLQGAVIGYDFETAGGWYQSNGTKPEITTYVTGDDAINGTSLTFTPSQWQGIFTNISTDTLTDVNYIYIKVKTSKTANINLRLNNAEKVAGTGTASVSKTEIATDDGYYIIKFDISNWEALNMSYGKEDVRSILIRCETANVTIVLDDVIFSTTELTF